MAFLEWLKAGSRSVLLEQVILSGSDVLLQGRGYALTDPPVGFQIIRFRNPILAPLIRRLGHALELNVGQPQAPVENVTSQAFEAGPLKPRGGKVVSRRYYFIDDKGNRSDPVQVSGIGMFKLIPKAKAEILEGFSGEVSIVEVEIRAAVDPDLTVRPLGIGDGLGALFDEIVADDADLEDSAATVAAVLRYLKTDGSDVASVDLDAEDDPGFITSIAQSGTEEWAGWWGEAKARFIDRVALHNDTEPDDRDQFVEVLVKLVATWGAAGLAGLVELRDELQVVHTAISYSWTVGWGPGSESEPTQFPTSIQIHLDEGEGVTFPVVVQASGSGAVRMAFEAVDESQDLRMVSDIVTVTLSDGAWSIHTDADNLTVYQQDRPMTI